MNTKEKIEVMQAFEDGEEIEYKTAHSGWVVATRPDWSWCYYDYRIKRTPKMVWANEYKEGGTSYHGTEERARRHANVNARRVAVKYVEEME